MPKKQIFKCRESIDCMLNLLNLRRELRIHANPQKAKLLQGFFKTGKGEYAEGDVFMGVMVPDTRKVAVKYKDLPLKDIEALLSSEIHEERLCALLILVYRFEKHPRERKEIFDFYLKNTKHINNWDLVDLSSHKIVGKWLLDKNRNVLYELAKSESLWERRISVISTFAFIANKNFNDSLRLAEILLHDDHDLMHKAVGWMLREIGKRERGVLERFLAKYYKKMPRTMLRYAIEKFPEKMRKEYLEGKV